MAREPIPTWYFVLVVVRWEGRYLLVQECKHGQLWYLPAGRVEPGEHFLEAAQRETLEETGIAVAIEGVLRVEHMPHPSGTARHRVIYVARPRADTTPKDTPDEHSLGAAWVSLADLDSLPLRGEEVRRILQHVDRGGAIYPLTLITAEGEAFPT